jgi:hypothetical protein
VLRQQAAPNVWELGPRLCQGDGSVLAAPAVVNVNRPREPEVNVVGGIRNRRQKRVECRAEDGDNFTLDDGTYSHAKTHTGACSHHGGVAEWYTKQ